MNVYLLERCRKIDPEYRGTLIIVKITKMNKRLREKIKHFKISYSYRAELLGIVVAGFDNYLSTPPPPSQ
jgi:hypothetical protein